MVLPFQKRKNSQKESKKDKKSTQRNDTKVVSSSISILSPASPSKESSLEQIPNSPSSTSGLDPSSSLYSPTQGNPLQKFSMKSAIDFLIGPSRVWSSDSAEVKMFKRNMSREKRDLMHDPIFSSNNSNYQYSGLPPVYLVPDWKRMQIEKKCFICFIYLDEHKMRKSAKISQGEYVNSFIFKLITKLNEKHNLQLNAMDYIFRAQGRFDFLYGDRPFGHFSYVHNCLKNSNKVNLYLVTKKSVIGDYTAKILDYDYQYKQKEGNSKTVHKALTIQYNSMINSTTIGTNFEGSNLLQKEMNYISLWDLKDSFRIFIIGVDIIPITRAFTESKLNPEDCALYIVVKLLHGGNSLCRKRFSRAIPYCIAPRFNQWIVFDDLHMCDLPRETKICFTLYCKPYAKSDQMLSSRNGEGEIGSRDYAVATIAASLFNHEDILKTGLYSPKMWLDEEGGSLSNTAENVAIDLSLPATTLSFRLQTFAVPVIFPSGEPPQFLKERFEEYNTMQSSKYKLPLEGEERDKAINIIIAKDPLYHLSKEEKWLLWVERNNLKNIPGALSKFLLSVPWNHPYAVYETHNLLDEWAPLEPIDALELLDYNFGDSKVRKYALSRLDTLEDDQLVNFLIQLAQTLKFELGHDSALARFLLQRSTRCPFLIGHYFFWHLVSEMHNPSIRERYGLILEEYLSSCGVFHVTELIKQKIVLKDLQAIAQKVKKCRTDRIALLHDELQHCVLGWPAVFRLPLDPKMEVCGVNLAGCRVMDSKKLPLWIPFINSDSEGELIHVIYKAGDDLRQDLLTIQILKIMDSMWKKENLDLHIKAYGCVCTGDESGMIEVVLNSETIASITSARGGASAAFTKDPLEKWLRKHNPTPEQWATCVENFMYSCAGYCTATYILGIGDRHNDNIMLQKDGNLFHIDFGHFLGHYKSFAGIVSRETSPFIFTKMYAQVLGNKGSEMFKQFQDYGARAYNIIRANGKVIISLFLLMLSTGIPELQSTNDIKWLCKCLLLEKTEEEGAQHFRKCVQKALKNIRAQINDAAHIQIHNMNINA